MLNKASGGRIPVRFIFFALVGLTGVAIHLATVNAALAVPDVTFMVAQSIAVVVAMTSNFLHQQRHHLSRRQAEGLLAAAAGPALFLSGLRLRRRGQCRRRRPGSTSIDHVVWISALAGVIMGSVWNFTLSSLFVWRKD